MSRRTKNREHPAHASAKRAIRRGLSHLKPPDVFRVAALVETLAYGEDRGHWALSVSYAADNPDCFEPPYHWTCDDAKDGA